MASWFEQKMREIHAQPEHIRLRYVYGCVALTMAFILLVWVASFRVNFSRASQVEQQNTGGNLQDQFREILPEPETRTSIDDLLPQEGPVDTSEGTAPQNGTEGGTGESIFNL